MVNDCGKIDEAGPSLWSNIELLITEISDIVYQQSPHGPGVPNECLGSNLPDFPLSLDLLQRHSPGDEVVTSILTKFPDFITVTSIVFLILY